MNTINLIEHHQTMPSYTKTNNFFKGNMSLKIWSTNDVYHARISAAVFLK